MYVQVVALDDSVDLCVAAVAALRHHRMVRHIMDTLVLVLHFLFDLDHLASSLRRDTSN